MSVYHKLMAARLELQSRPLSKSGHNKFAGYNYFELGDFLPTVQEIFAKHDLCGIISYGTEVARLTIVDMSENGGSIEVTSPMSSAALKGCHEVQNLGAVQTYIRRYLWVTAMEIVEHDALDSSQPLKPDEAKPAQKKRPANYDPKAQIPSVKGIEQYWEPSRIGAVERVVQAAISHYQAGDVVGAYEECSGITDGEEKTYMFSQFTTEMRRALKEQHAVATS